MDYDELGEIVSNFVRKSDELDEDDEWGWSTYDNSDGTADVTIEIIKPGDGSNFEVKQVHITVDLATARVIEDEYE